jgi:ABC-type multidrug transport system fused ATPase/permease subunit
VRSQLETLVFHKSLRLKEVRDARHDAAGAKASDETTTASDDSKDSDDNTDSDAGDNQMNLISYDAERVSSFCSNVAMVVPMPLFEGIVCYSLLGRLLGWRPLVVITLFTLVFIGLQFFIFKRYARGEERVMDARDVKTRTVTEAVRGIRQIKFAAQEEYWAKRIDADRMEELRRVWVLMWWDTGLWIIYNTASAVLIVSALASYAYFEGELKPSVAFSAIAALQMFNDTMYFLPVCGGAFDAGGC